MNIDEAIKFLKSMQNPLEDYADMIGAPAGMHGIKYVYPDPEDYAIEEAIEALKRAEKYKWHDLRKDPDDLPDIEHEVEVAYTTLYTNGSVKTARAVYEDGSITQSESAFDWEEYVGNDGECCYSEEKDEYMIPVGWFESHWYGEDCHEMYDAEIIAWREIEPFKEK